jgi:putative hydrolase of the HAD superfamily
MIKAIIFDCFGVLLNDSMDAAVGTLSVSGRQRQDLRDIMNAANLGLLTAKEAREQHAQVLGISAEEWTQLVASHEGRDTRLFAYILELKKRYKTAILSNVSEGGISRRFSAEELAQYFDVVVESGAIGVGKPDAEIYEHTLKKLDIMPNEAIFTDDRDEYCAAAVEAGLSAILFTGFDKFKSDLEELLVADSNS